MYQSPSVEKVLFRLLRELDREWRQLVGVAP
jgi:hypothetical protein